METAIKITYSYSVMMHFQIEQVALLASVAFGMVNFCFSLQFQLHGLDKKIVGATET